MAHQVSEVIPHHVDICEVRVDGPTILHVLAIDSPFDEVVPPSALQLELAGQPNQVETYFLEEVDLENTLDQDVRQLYFFHFEEKIEIAVRSNQLRFVQQNGLNSLKIASSHVPLARNHKLLKHLRLLGAFETIVIAEIFYQLKILFPLLGLVEEEFAAPVDFFVVIGKDVLLFVGVQNWFFHLFVVLHYVCQILSLEEKSVLFIIVQRDFIDH